MAPAPERITRSLIFSCGIFIRASVTASTEPCTSALITSGSSLSWPSAMARDRSSRRILDEAAMLRSRSLSWRKLTIDWALIESCTTISWSPGSGGAARPWISTGVEGPACLRRRPWSSTRARTLPATAPATTLSPTDRVPSWTSTVATGPRPLSRRASSTVPMAGRLGLPLSSFMSATSSSISSSWSRFWRFLAETLTNTASPPHSSGIRPRSESCCLTRSGWASGLSILLTATTIGTPAARAWSMASSVWGITPSSAATTSTTMSVTLAPRARIRVKASWPGVSRNTTRRSPTSTW